MKQAKTKQQTQKKPLKPAYKWGKWQLSIFACICSLVVASCQPKPATQTPQTPQNATTQRLSIGTTLKLRTIDPADSYEQASATWINNLGERLYTYQVGTTKIIPQLATELPKISKDGLTYIIPLRKNVIFHDGTEFNAKAMEFSLQRFMENQGNPAVLLTDIVASVKATAPYELTIKLKQPFSAFTALLTFNGMCAVSPKAYELGAGKFKPTTFVGTGPYQLTKYAPDSLKLDIFDKYWGEKTKNQGVDVQFYNSAGNLYNAFSTGGVDIAYQELDSQQIRTLEQQAKSKNWQVTSASGNYVTHWVLNISKAPLNNPEIRKALALIVDRELLAERVRFGQSEPLYSMIPSKFEASKPVFKERYSQNAEKAKQLLTKAGYTQQNPLKIEIWYPSPSPNRELLGNALKAIAQEKLDGMLQLEINTVERPVAFANLKKGIYQTFLQDWYADFFDADNFVQPFLDCRQPVGNVCKNGASQNLGSFYYSQQMNQLIDRQRKELNAEKRNQILRQIDEVVAQDVPYIPLLQNKDHAFTQANIQGVVLDPTQQLPLWGIQKK